MFDRAYQLAEQLLEALSALTARVDALIKAIDRLEVKDRV